MKRILVRYKTKPDQVQENQALIHKVFEELHATEPDDVRYLVLRLADGTFLHFASVEGDGDSNPIPQLNAFKVFQSAIKERCAEPPQTQDATVVGQYRALSD